jgi:hypothetical protein
MIAKHTIANTVPYPPGMRFKRGEKWTGVIVKQCDCTAPWGLHYEVKMDDMDYVMSAGHGDITPISTDL